MKNVITYGSFDLLHYGHIELLRRAKELAGKNGKLYVGLSSEQFNKIKGKKTYLGYRKRKQLLESLRFVDKVFPEHDWEQKRVDIEKYNIGIFLMGGDWKGKFDDLKNLCDVVYLERTPDVSSTIIKRVFDETNSKHSTF